MSGKPIAPASFCRRSNRSNPSPCWSCVGRISSTPRATTESTESQRDRSTTSSWLSGRSKNPTATSRLPPSAPDTFWPFRPTLATKRITRAYVNKTIGIIQRMFKWGVSRELVPPAVHTALSAVEGLRMGRSAAKESTAVAPVPDDVVDATLPHLPPVVADMVRFERLTGCRPGEVCMIRPCDVDRSGEVWQYRPESHKTEHHGHERIIYIGPQAQAVLLPLLAPRRPGPLFPAGRERTKTPRGNAGPPANARTAEPVEPEEGQAGAVAQKHLRPQQLRPGGQAGRRKGQRRAAETNPSGRRRRSRVVAALAPQPAPSHARRRKYVAGSASTAAQVIMGHAKADVTQVYAEKNSALAVEIAKKIG